MKDLQLVGGDLFPSGRGFATVTGDAYLRQRVSLALSERYGADPFHPQWGSALRGYLGAPITAGTPALVSSEVSRVLDQIIAAQKAQITAAGLAQQKSLLAAADVISSVDSVVTSPGLAPDSLQVAVSLTTAAGAQLTVTRTVSA